MSREDVYLPALFKHVDVIVGIVLCCCVGPMHLFASQHFDSSCSVSIVFSFTSHGVLCLFVTRSLSAVKFESVL